MLTQIKTLPASRVKNNFGAVVSQVQNGTYHAVIVENHGEPIVAIITVKELEVMKEFREQERRKEALTRLRNVRAEVQARMKVKLSEQEVENISNRFSRELVEDLEKEGKIRFERKGNFTSGRRE